MAWLERVQMNARDQRVRREGPPPLGIHLLMGASAPTKLQNVHRNLEEERIRVIQAVFRA